MAKHERELTPQQLEAIKLLTEFPPKYKSMDGLAQMLGINITTLWRWRFENDKFKKMYDKEIERNYVAYGGLVRAAVVKGALKGDKSLIKLFFQHAEKWIPTEAQKIDVDARVTTIAEIIKSASEEKKSQEE